MTADWQEVRERGREREGVSERWREGVCTFYSSLLRENDEEEETDG